MRAGILLRLVFIGLAVWVCFMLLTRMKKTERPVLDQKALQELEALSGRLKNHVVELAGRIGERNVYVPDALDEAARYITGSWSQLGLNVDSHEYEVQGVVSRNLFAEIPGKDRPDEIVILAAHYDSVIGSPGADDNASGVAALLEISRYLHKSPGRRTIRFIAFVNEEPPFFQSSLMGSRVYARERFEKGEKIHAALSMDTIGYYTDRPGSQRYPLPVGWIYPNTGNFLLIVGNLKNGGLVRRVKKAFLASTDFPVEGASFPEFVPGVTWSDHASFWEYGYSAVMLTDTAPFRYSYYHTGEDTPDHLDYPGFARVAHGLAGVVKMLADEP